MFDVYVIPKRSATGCPTRSSFEQLPPAQYIDANSRQDQSSIYCSPTSAERVFVTRRGRNSDGGCEDRLHITVAAVKSRRLRARRELRERVTTRYGASAQDVAQK